MGCPRLMLMLPLQWTAVSDEFAAKALAIADALAERFEETSPEWLVLVCYARAVALCMEVSAGTDPAASRHLLVLGATLRQIELTLINKNLAQTERAQMKGRLTGRDVAVAAAARKAEPILVKIEGYKAKGHSITNAARLTFDNDRLGTSAEANRTLWNSYRRKRKWGGV